MSTSVQTQARIEHMQSPEPSVRQVSDLSWRLFPLPTFCRLTALVTLSNELKNNTFNTLDVHSNMELVHQVLNLLSDQEDSISNQAADCLGQLIKVVRVSLGDQIICRLTEHLSGTDVNLRDTACLGIEKLTLELPQDNIVAPRAVRKIVPTILRLISDLTASSETLVRALTVLDVIVKRFPTHVCTMDPIVVPTSLFAHGDAQVRKHAIRTTASVISSQPIANVQAFIDTKILSCLGSSAAEVDEKIMAMDLISALAYHTIPNVEQVIPSVLPSVKSGDGKLKNAGLRALERLVVFFSSEMAAYVSELIAISTECIKHHASNGEDIAMVDATGSNFNYSTDGMNDLGDDRIQYPEDDHTDIEAPYETRRLAIRLLSAVASTNLKSLPKLFESAWQALIITIGDHEPMIRQASHSGLVVLLRQAHKFASDRSNFGPADSFDRAKPLPETKELLSALDKLVPELLTPMLKVLSPSVTPHPATLMLLDAIITPLPEASPLSCLTRDGLEPFEEQLYKVLVQPGALRTFTHLIETGFPDEDVRSELVELMHSSDPSVAAEAIRAGLGVIHRTCSEYCSIHDDDPAFPKGLQAEARRRMQDPHADATIQKLSAKVIGALLVAEFDCAEEDWELVRKMGATSVIRGAINMTDKFSHRGYDFAESWLQANTDWCIGILRDGVDKDGGPTKLDVMECLETLIWQHSRGDFDEDLVGNIVDATLPYLALADPVIFNRSLELLDSILYHDGRNEATLETMEEKVLPRLYPLACEPLPSSSHPALLQLVGRVAGASQDIAIKMVSGFKSAFETKVGDASTAGTVSSCLVKIATTRKSVTANIVEDFAQDIKPPVKCTPNLQVLCLLTLGKLARTSDMSRRPKVFDGALELFKSDSEEVRNAAAFAVGNIATRSPDQHLPMIAKQIQTDGKTQPLYMRAFKEFMPSCSQASLGSIAKSLWQPLLDIYSAYEDLVDTTAVCLGKLAMTDPSRFLPLLEAHLQDPSPAMRVLAVSTLQSLLGSGAAGKDGKNDEKELDERLIPLILVLLAMLGDQDPSMKKLNLATLRQATSSKSRLIEDLVPSLLPKLYDETRSKSGTTKISGASLGEPETNDKEEDRLTAYKILRDVFEAFPSKLDLPGFLIILLRGLSDRSKDINEISLAMLYDLFGSAPTKVAQRLDDVAEPLRALLKEAPADESRGSHHVEQSGRLQKPALDASAAFSWALGLSYDGAPRFAAFAKELESGSWGPKFKEQRAESKPVYVA